MNYWAVLVASVISYVIMMIWYSPGLFGKAWMKLTKIKKCVKSANVFIAAFINTIVFNAVLAAIILFTGVYTFWDGLLIGGLVWLGFIVTTMYSGILWEKMPWKLFWINSLSYLLVMLINGGILAVW